MGLATAQRAEAPKGSDRVQSLLDAVSDVLDDVRLAVDELTPEETAALAVGMFGVEDQVQVTARALLCRSSRTGRSGQNKISRLRGRGWRITGT